MDLEFEAIGTRALGLAGFPVRAGLESWLGQPKLPSPLGTERLVTPTGSEWWQAPRNSTMTFFKLKVKFLHKK